MENQLVKLILISSIVRLIPWVTEATWLIHDLINNISLGTIFAIFCILTYRKIIFYLFFLTCFFEILFVLSDYLYIDKYDTAFEYIHLSLIFILIFESIKHLRSEK